MVNFYHKNVDAPVYILPLSKWHDNNLFVRQTVEMENTTFTYRKSMNVVPVFVVNT